MRIDQFREWLNRKTTLSESSVSKYVAAVRTVSKDMIGLELISKSMYDMSLNELDCAIKLIFSNPFFRQKDKTGQHMYSCAMKHYRYFVVDECDFAECLSEDFAKLEQDRSLSSTERSILAKARIGRGLFKNKLMAKYNSHCIITGICEPRVLIASHIKPWSVCDNNERLAVSNGLLLSATYDKLFDGGLISFKNDGRIIVSERMDSESKSILRIESGEKYDIKPDELLVTFLEYHRDVVLL